MKRKLHFSRLSWVAAITLALMACDPEKTILKYPMR